MIIIHSIGWNGNTISLDGITRRRTEFSTFIERFRQVSETENTESPVFERKSTSNIDVYMCDENLYMKRKSWTIRSYCIRFETSIYKAFRHVEKNFIQRFLFIHPTFFIYSSKVCIYCTRIDIGCTIIQDLDE